MSPHWTVATAVQVYALPQGNVIVHLHEGGYNGT